MKGYVFWIKRPVDSREWPLIFENQEQAEKYPNRCTPVLEVIYDKTTCGPPTFTFSIVKNDAN